jgi:putative pyruvate formate lyase activating enzyme
MIMERAVPRYLKIVSGKARPRFKSASLDSKIRRASGILKNCELCERKCGVDRGKAKGFCGVGEDLLVTSIFDHWGEEPFLVPSFTVFFWSCTFSCQFCQNWSISQRFEVPRKMDEKELADTINNCSCRNVNFVGGEPTPYIPFILKTLKHIKKDIPVVWNSNFYMSRKSMSLLRGVVDVYLSDFKYGNDKCAGRLSKVPNYFGIVSRNHMLAKKDSELVIRHLVLPNHVECCTKPVLDFIAKNFGDRVIVNVMPQYRPEYRASEHQDISRGLGHGESEEAVKHAEKLGLNFIR